MLCLTTEVSPSTQQTSTGAGSRESCRNRARGGAGTAELIWDAEKDANSILPPTSPCMRGQQGVGSQEPMAPQ